MKIKNQTKKESQKKRKYQGIKGKLNLSEKVFFQFVFETCRTLSILNVLGKLN